MKFTPEGGAVRVSLDVTESRVELVVSDTGIGIAPAFLPYAFERFRKAMRASHARMAVWV